MSEYIVPTRYKIFKWSQIEVIIHRSACVADVMIIIYDFVNSHVSHSTAPPHGQTIVIYIDNVI